MQPRLRHELEREVRLAVGEPAADRRSHARRHVGVDDVHVERDVHERRALDPLQRLADGRLDAAPVELAHRVDADAALPHEGPLALVERAHADRGRRASGSSAGSGQASLAKASGSRPSAAASGIPCTFPLGLVAGVFRSPCASSQSDPARPVAPTRARRGSRARSSGRRRGRSAFAPPRPPGRPRGRCARTSP